MDVNPKSWGVNILSDLVADLRRSGTPALIYMIPVNIRAIEGDSIASANFVKLEKWFSEFAELNSNGNITIISKTPSRFIDDIDFYDTSHVTNPGKFVEYLATEIKAHAKISTD